MDRFEFNSQAREALASQDLLGMEQIIKEVGPEAAFGHYMTEDFTQRTLIHYFENYPKGLPLNGGRIHTEFLMLGLKYSPWITIGQRVTYLRKCDKALDYLASDNHSLIKYRQAYSGFGLRWMTPPNKETLVAFRKSIFLRATAEERLLLENDTVPQPEEPRVEKCEGGNDLVTLGNRFGKFLSCGKFPECRVAISTRPGERATGEVKDNWEIAWKTAMEKCSIVHPEAADAAASEAEEKIRVYQKSSTKLEKRRAEREARRAATRAAANVKNICPCSECLTERGLLFVE
jgi:ssDNA-binding Zn-finger/Zn-ribbon topoisomerase 1